MPTSTSTATPPPSTTASPTPNPIESIEFVENEDCQTNISRELLPTTEMTLMHGATSFSIVAEVADDSRERQQGLMCREIVPPGSGMLFIFQQASSLNFWMFNTYAPLDILYLDDNRRVVNAVRMEPCPRPNGYDYDVWRGACSSAATGYGSKASAQYALELPAGWLESIGLKLDDLKGLEVSW